MTALGTFGLAALVIVTVPGARAIGLAILAAALPIVLAVSLTFRICILTPVWEEATFRGVIHGGLRHRFDRLVTSLLSAATFAFVHGVPLLLPYMFTLGLCLAALREFHRTLWAPVVLHVLLNSMVTAGVLVSALS